MVLMEATYLCRHIIVVEVRFKLRRSISADFRFPGTSKDLPWLAMSLLSFSPSWDHSGSNLGQLRFPDQFIHPWYNFLRHKGRLAFRQALPAKLISRLSNRPRVECKDPRLKSAPWEKVSAISFNKDTIVLSSLWSWGDLPREYLFRGGTTTVH